jgi:hypothetical protein
MIELMPVHCCAMATPIPAMKMRRIHGTERSLPAPHVGLFLLRGEELDLLHLRAGPLRGPDLHEDGERLVVPVLRDEPARRLGHLHHADEQGDRGDGGDREHVAPHPRVLAPDGADDGVDREGEQLADDDRQLTAAGEAASALGGGQLGQVHRHGDRGAADRETEDHPRRDHDREARGQHTADGPDEEDDGQDGQRLLPAQDVVEPSADERSDRGSDQQGARDQALARRGQPQVRLHRLQGTVDHACVVTEEQAAERRDDRDQVEPPLVRTGCEWWQRDATGLVHVHRCLRWRCPPRRAALSVRNRDRLLCPWNAAMLRRLISAGRADPTEREGTGFAI